MCVCTYTFLCFKQDLAIFPLNGKFQLFVDQFTYLVSNILSTGSEVNIGKGMNWY